MKFHYSVTVWKSRAAWSDDEGIRYRTEYTAISSELRIGDEIRVEGDRLVILQRIVDFDTGIIHIDVA